MGEICFGDDAFVRYLSWSGYVWLGVALLKAQRATRVILQSKTPNPVGNASL